MTGCLRPNRAHQSRHRIALFFFLRRAPLSTKCKAAVKHKVGYPLRVPHGVADSNGAALRDSDQRETLNPSGIDHRFQVANPSVKGKLIDVPVGHAVAARIISDQRVVAR